MVKDDLLRQYGEELDEVLRQKGTADFVQGSIAELRRNCLSSGITERELDKLEDRLVEKYQKRPEPDPRRFAYYHA